MNRLLQIMHYFDPELGEILFYLHHKAHSLEYLFQFSPDELLGKIGAKDEGELFFRPLGQFKEIACLQTLHYAFSIVKLVLELLSMSSAHFLVQFPELFLIRMCFNEVQK